MAIVNQVQKRVKMPKWDLVKYQILTHCYINKLSLSESDLNCLTLLSFNQPVELTDFCYDASSEEGWIFKSPQTVRNSINSSVRDSVMNSVYYSVTNAVDNKLKTYDFTKEK